MNSDFRHKGRPSVAATGVEEKWSIFKNENEIGSWIVDKSGRKIAYSQFSTTIEEIVTEHNAAVLRYQQENAQKEKLDEQTVKERDDAEEAVSQAYYLVTGNSPEWSNNFGYTHALRDIDDAQRRLREEIKALQQENERQAKELDRERMCHAACGVIAMSNTVESLAKNREMLPEYLSASVQDCIRAIERELAIQQENAELEEKLGHMTKVAYEVPLCGDHAATWFTARHFQEGDCWFCQYESESQSLRETLTEIRQYTRKISPYDANQIRQIIDAAALAIIYLTDLWSGRFCGLRRDSFGGALTWFQRCCLRFFPRLGSGFYLGFRRLNDAPNKRRELLCGFNALGALGRGFRRLHCMSFGQGFVIPPCFSFIIDPSFESSLGLQSSPIKKFGAIGRDKLNIAFRHNGILAFEAKDSRKRTDGRTLPSFQDGNSLVRCDSEVRHRLPFGTFNPNHSAIILKIVNWKYALVSYTERHIDGQRASKCRIGLNRDFRL